MKLDPKYSLKLGTKHALAHNRRKFLKRAGKATASVGLMAHAPFTLLMNSETASAAEIPTGPRRLPRSLGSMRSGDLEGDLSVVSGAIPDDLSGHFFVIAPVPQDDGAPVLNGDGQVYRFDFRPSAPAHLKMAILKTPCYYVDRAFTAGKYEFRNRGIPRLNFELGTRNQVNTAFLNLGTRLLATFDAGRPFEIDPLTLRLTTPIGWNSEWRSAMPRAVDWLNKPLFPNVMTSAHPAYDENTGEFFSVNYSSIPTAKFFDLIRWDGVGAFERWKILLPNGDEARITQSAHQIAITEDFIILADTGFFVESKQVLFDPDAVSAQNPDTTFFIITRSDLRPGSGRVYARRLVVPREMGHFVADYRNPGGMITLHCAHNSAWDPSEWLRDQDIVYETGDSIRYDLRGMVVGPTDPTPLGKYVFNGYTGALDYGASGTLTDPLLSWGTVFFTGTKTQMPMDRFKHLFWASTGFSKDLVTRRIAEVYADYPYRQVSIDKLPTDGTPANIARVDVENMRIEDSYCFPDGTFASSPQWMPSERGGAGYLACVVLSDIVAPGKSAGDEVWIFRADALQAGPICRLGHPRLSMGFTLHTAYMDLMTEAPAPSPYYIPLEVDYAEALQHYGSEMTDVFTGQVFPSFARR